MKSHTARNVFTRLTISAVFLSGASLGAFAQTADDSAAQEYTALLEQIGNLKIAIAQREAFVANQEAEIQSLEAQIEATPALTESVGPMFDKMASAIESELNSDLPFKQAERFARLDDFREILNDEAALPSDKMRKALNIYNVEVSYGNSLESYPGDHPVSPGARLEACRAAADSAKCNLDKDQVDDMAAGATIEDLKGGLMDGDYLRYGRVALVYMDNDEGEAMRYDPSSKEWVTLSGQKVLDVRRGIRIAKGEAAPGVVTAPVYVAGAN